MKRLTLAAISAAFLLLPGAAMSKQTKLERTYLQLYHATRRDHGARAVGCNLIERRGNCHVRATATRLRASIIVLDRIEHPVLNPPAPVAMPAVPGVSTSMPTDVAIPVYTTTIQSPSYGGSSAGLPSCTWQPESGGNWNAVNPSSGAYGYYQILPSTAASNGCDLSTHDGQTKCAEKIYYDPRQGPHSWVGC